MFHVYCSIGGETSRELSCPFLEIKILKKKCILKFCISPYLNSLAKR